MARFRRKQISTFRHRVYLYGLTADQNPKLVCSAAWTDILGERWSVPFYFDVTTQTLLPYLKIKKLKLCRGYDWKAAVERCLSRSVFKLT
jgi:hypothetical protein